MCPNYQQNNFYIQKANIKIINKMNWGLLDKWNKYYPEINEMIKDHMHVLWLLNLP